MAFDRKRGTGAAGRQWQHDHPDGEEKCPFCSFIGRNVWAVPTHVRSQHEKAEGS